MAATLRRQMPGVLGDYVPPIAALPTQPPSATQGVLGGYVPPGWQPPDPTQQPPPELDQAALQDAEATANREQYGQDNPFMSGLAAGWEGLKGSAHGLAGLAKGAFGDTAGERSSLQAMQANQQRAAQYSTGSPAGLHDIHGVGDAFTWAEHALGEAVPSLAATVLPAVVTGGVGGVVSAGLRRAALGALAKKAGEAALERGLGEEAAGAATKAALPRLTQIADQVSPVSKLGTQIGQDVGAVGGGTLVSGGPAASTVDPNASDAELQAQSQKALAGAGAEGALMSIPGLTLLRRYGIGKDAEAVVAKQAPKLLARMAGEGGKQAAIVGGIGVSAAAANRVLHNWVTGKGLSDGLISPEALTEYMNSGAAGALAGFAFGAPAGAFHGAPVDPNAPAPPPGRFGLGVRAKAARIFAAMNKVQQGARKPAAGEEINLDGTPKTPAAGPAKTRKPAAGEEINLDGTPKTPAAGPEDIGSIMHSKLEEVQTARTKAEQELFGDLRPYQVEEHPTGQLTIGTSENVPGAQLFDVARVKPAVTAARAAGTDPFKAAVASLLPDTDPALQLAEHFGGPKAPGAERAPMVDAATKALREGYQSLSEGQQKPFGDFLNLLPPDQATTFKRHVLTADMIGPENMSRLELMPKKTGDAVEAGTPETSATSDTGLAGRMTEREAAPNDELTHVPDVLWKKMQFSGDRSRRTSPAEENVTLHTTQKDGTPTAVDFNMRAAASSVARSPEGRAFIDAQVKSGMTRKAAAVLGVLSDARVRGERIDPKTIREGLQVFRPLKDENGKIVDDGTLNRADLATISKAARAAKLTPRAKAASDALRAQQRPVEKPQADQATQAAATATRAARGEAGADTTLARPRDERPSGDGDFESKLPLEPGPRERKPAAVSDIMTPVGEHRSMHLEAAQKVAKQMNKMAEEGVKINARIKAGLHVDTGKARLAELRPKYAALKAQHDELIAKHNAEVKAARGGTKERGAGESPPDTTQRHQAIALAHRMADKLGLNSSRNLAREDRGSLKRPQDDATRLAKMYEGAKAMPDSPERTALLGAVRRIADDEPKVEPQQVDLGTKTTKVNEFNEPLTKRRTVEHGAMRETLSDKLDKIDNISDRPQGVQSEADRAAMAKRDAQRAKEDKATPKAEAPKRVSPAQLAARAAKSKDDIQHSKLDEGEILSRSDEDPRSVAATVAEARKNPAYKKLFKILDDAAKAARDIPKQTKKLQGTVDTLSKAFNAPTIKIERFAKGAKVDVGGMSHELGLGALYHRNGEFKIYLRDDLQPHEVISTLTHEFGHFLQKTKFEDLPMDSPIKMAIFQDFARWHMGLKETDKARAIRASRAPFFGTLADVRLTKTEGKELGSFGPGSRQYLTSFNEYFADNVARALQAHEGVQGIVGKFFANIAHAMKLVYDLMGGRGDKMVDAPKSFKDFVAQTYFAGSEKPPEVAARERADAANNLHGMPREEALAAAAEAPNDAGLGGNGERPPGGVPGAGDRPSDVTMTLNPKDRILLEKAVTTRGTFEAILKEFPELKDRLMNYATQMETAINASYALWSMGKLELSGEGYGKGYLPAMRRFAENVKNVFGLKSRGQLGERIYSELKSGAYTKERDVVTRQRSEYEANLRARHDTARAAGKESDAAVLKARIGLRRAINYSLGLHTRVVGPMTDRFLRNLDDRMRAIGSPAARRLVSLFHLQTGERGHGEGMLQAQMRNFGKFSNELMNTVGNLSGADDATLSRALFIGKPIEGNAKLEAIRQQLTGENGFTSRLERYVREAGRKGNIQFGHIENMSPYRIQFQRVRDNPEKFKSILMDKDPNLVKEMRKFFMARETLGKSKEDAVKGAEKVNAMTQEEMVDAFYNMAAHDPNVHLRQEDMEAMRGAPSGPSFRPRVMDFLRKADRPDLIEKMAEFQNPSVVETYLPFIRSAVKRAEYYRRNVRTREVTGPDGKTRTERYDLPNELIERMGKEGATEQQIQLARNYVDAQLGQFNMDTNPIIHKVLSGMDNLIGTKMADPESRTWEKFSNAMVTYQNVRVLGLGILGNMIDPLGVWTRSSSFTNTWNSYRKAARAAFGKNNASFLRAHAEALGVVERHALAESMSWAMGATGTPGTLSYKINQTVFRLNGMTMMTRFARLAALAGGHKFLLEHAQGASKHSARYLEELGLKPEDIRPDAQHPGFVDVSGPTGEKVQKALFQFVDESVVRPVASQRPLWHADPNFKMASQYKGFIFSFYATIMKRMFHEVKNGNLGGVVPMVGYIGVTMAAELAREMIQYGPNGNPNHADWGFSDYMSHNLQRAGVMGPRADFLAEARSELSFGGLPIPYEAATGPTVGQIDNLLDVAIGKRSSWNEAVSTLPGESIYGGYLKNRGAAHPEPKLAPTQ